MTKKSRNKEKKIKNTIREKKTIFVLYFQYKGTPPPPPSQSHNRQQQPFKSFWKNYKKNGARINKDERVIVVKKKGRQSVGLCAIFFQSRSYPQPTEEFKIVH